MSEKLKVRLFCALLTLIPAGCCSLNYWHSLLVTIISIRFCALISTDSEQTLELLEDLYSLARTNLLCNVTKWKIFPPRVFEWPSRSCHCHDTVFHGFSICTILLRLCP